MLSLLLCGLDGPAGMPPHRMWEEKKSEMFLTYVTKGVMGKQNQGGDVLSDGRDD